MFTGGGAVGGGGCGDTGPGVIIGLFLTAASAAASGVGTAPISNKLRRAGSNFTAFNRLKRSSLSVGSMSPRVASIGRKRNRLRSFARLLPRRVAVVRDPVVEAGGCTVCVVSAGRVVVGAGAPVDSSERELYQNKIAAKATKPPIRIFGSTSTRIPKILVVLAALTVVLSSARSHLRESRPESEYSC